MNTTKDLIIPLSCALLLVLSSCGKEQQLRIINIPTASIISTGSATVIVNKKDLWQWYSLQNSKLYYWEEELVLSVMRKDIILDITSVEPISYTFFKDSKYVYARSFQDPASFDIVENADPKTFKSTNTGHSYEWIDRNWKYIFWTKVEKFSTGELNTASCQGWDCR